MPTERAANKIIRSTASSCRSLAQGLDRQAGQSRSPTDIQLLGSHARQLELVADGLERAAASGDDTEMLRAWAWLGIVTAASAAVTGGTLLSDGALARDATRLATTARGPAPVPPRTATAANAAPPPPPGSGLPPAPSPTPAASRAVVNPNATVVARPGSIGPEPGWYPAPGDPENTERYWDGQAWVGGPQPAAGALGGGGGPKKKGRLDSIRKHL